MVSAKNLKFDHPTTVVDHTYKGFKFSTYLRLMASCRPFHYSQQHFCLVGGPGLAAIRRSA